MQKNCIEAAIPELEKVIAKIKPDTSTKLHSVIAGLYSADPRGFLRFSGLIGLLQLDMDRKLKSRFLRLYDLQTLLMVFQVELYYNFHENYRSIGETLYQFDYPKGTFAFLFRSKQQAELMKIKIQTQSPKQKQYDEMKAHIRQQQEAHKKQEDKKGIFGKIKSFFNGNDEPVKEQGVVLNFKKQTSIKFNLANGQFNTQNVPPQWQQLFSSLNLTKQQLKSKEVMGIIIQQTILNQVERQAEKQHNRDLQKKVQNAKIQIANQEKEFYQETKRNKMLQLPPPPPPPPPMLAPPHIRATMIGERANLMDQIRNNNIKLKHVQVNQKDGKQQVELDISDMNRQQRMDLGERMRLKLKKRAQILRGTQEQDD